jgi:hypothetical protein
MSANTESTEPLFTWPGALLGFISYLVLACIILFVYV